MTPEAIEKAEFPPSLRGYDKLKVRLFLRGLGSEFSQLQKDLASARAQVTTLSERLSATAQQQDVRQDSVPSMPPEPPRQEPDVGVSDSLETMDADQFDKFGVQIAGLLRDARDSATETKSKADFESQALLEDAQSRADKITLNSQEQADQLLQAAEKEKQQSLTTSEQILASARTEADEVRSRTEAEIAARVQQCDEETANRYRQADEALLQKQQEADELWNLAEAEAFKVRESGRSEATEILESAELERSTKVSEADVEAERIREACDLEVQDLRQKANEELERIRVENDLACKERLLEAERTLADHQKQATDVLAHANDEAERLMSDAFAEVDRIRLDGETSVAKMRSDADQDLAAKHEEADAYVTTMTQEGDDYLATRKIEADEFYERRYTEAEEYVAARQGEVFKDAEEAQAARDQAFTEIADAREQVSELLEQARAQSEFIRQEAEEVIRAKVRSNIDQAERRISRLRVTEQASRERILAAQKELQSAIIHLDNEPMVELGDGTDESVLVEATERALEAGSTFDTEAEIAAISDAGYGTGNATPPPENAVENGETTPADDDEEEIIDLTGVEVVDDDAPKDGEVSSDNGGSEDAQGTQVKTANGSFVANTPPSMPIPPPPGAVHKSSDVPGVDGKSPIEQQSTVTDPVADVEKVLSEPIIEPQDEDALSRLVQEAMKRAVESAKSSDGPQR